MQNNMCYIPYVMFYNMCYVMLYNKCYSMLYNMLCHITCVILLYYMLRYTTNVI